jgi:hypothetical protein
LGRHREMISNAHGMVRHVTSMSLKEYSTEQVVKKRKKYKFNGSKC